MIDVVLALVVLVASLLGAPPNPQRAGPDWPGWDPVVVVPVVLASLLLVFRRSGPAPCGRGPPS